MQSALPLNSPQICSPTRSRPPCPLFCPLHRGGGPTTLLYDKLPGGPQCITLTHLRVRLWLGSLQPNLLLFFPCQPCQPRRSSLNMPRSLPPLGLCFFCSLPGMPLPLLCPERSCSSISAPLQFSRVPPSRWQKSVFTLQWTGAP